MIISWCTSEGDDAIWVRENEPWSNNAGATRWKRPKRCGRGQPARANGERPRACVGKCPLDCAAKYCTATMEVYTIYRKYTKQSICAPSRSEHRIPTQPHRLPFSRPRPVRIKWILFDRSGPHKSDRPVRGIPEAHDIAIIVPTVVSYIHIDT